MHFYPPVKTQSSSATTGHWLSSWPDAFITCHNPIAPASTGPASVPSAINCLSVEVVEACRKQHGFLKKIIKIKKLLIRIRNQTCSDHSSYAPNHEFLQTNSTFITQARTNLDNIVPIIANWDLSTLTNFAAPHRPIECSKTYSTYGN